MYYSVKDSDTGITFLSYVMFSVLFNKDKTKPFVMDRYTQTEHIVTHTHTHMNGLTDRASSWPDRFI